MERRKPMGINALVEPFIPLFVPAKEVDEQSCVFSFQNFRFKPLAEAVTNVNERIHCKDDAL